MGVTTKLADGVCVFSLDGAMNIHTAAEIKNELLDCMTGCRELHLDLSQVREIDTAGVQLMLLARFEATRQNRSVHFIGHSEAVREVIQLFNLAASIGDWDMSLAYR